VQDKQGGCRYHGTDFRTGSIKKKIPDLTYEAGDRFSAAQGDKQIFENPVIKALKELFNAEEYKG
jgi:hypothetical protein